MTATPTPEEIATDLVARIRSGEEAAPIITLALMLVESRGYVSGCGTMRTFAASALDQAARHGGWAAELVRRLPDPPRAEQAGEK